MNKTLETAAVGLAGTVTQARTTVTGNIGRDGGNDLLNVDIALQQASGYRLRADSGLRLPAVRVGSPCQALRLSISAAGAGKIAHFRRF